MVDIIDSIIKSTMSVLSVIYPNKEYVIEIYPGKRVVKARIGNRQVMIRDY